MGITSCEKFNCTVVLFYYCNGTVILFLTVNFRAKNLCRIIFVQCAHSKYSSEKLTLYNYIVNIIFMLFLRTEIFLQ